MTDLQAAARILGVRTTASPLLSDAQYLALVARGFPVRTLYSLANAVAPGDGDFKYRIVPRASLARYKSAKRLSSLQSVVITRIASVWAMATRIWKSDQAARAFLQRPHPLLDGRKPIDLVLENELGASLVREALGRLENGSAV